jgi:hypothetical protein
LSTGHPSPSLILFFEQQKGKYRFNTFV